ncbi:putative NifZ protein [Rhodovastum atsumiense]|uniref:Nitrogen fixation protein NifZ n=1 Tax=Rhodovastum atsumiense TaxID=504468 RepID=A0A5M6IZC1_9PROT|nr:nitrogen fixation protein NifZ [Rhodovastum atsumiense]KAA5613631.1 nitrogen fixation protein NifZ [Rhodovastum atsumiense]CAH2599536.1 putative NifZ protein [Rhodovastum atsumiense]
MAEPRDDDIDVFEPPRFRPGAKVRAIRHIRNDGTFPGREIGEFLVRKGDEGYVRDIGTFLQRYWIYAVDFIDRGAVVGMRARELRSVEEAAP